MWQYTPLTKAPVLYGSSYVSYLAEKLRKARMWNRTAVDRVQGWGQGMRNYCLEVTRFQFCQTEHLETC